MAISPRRLLAPLAAASASLFAVADASCRVTSTGTADGLLLKGTVLTSDGAVTNGRVLVQAGKIAYAGAQCGLRSEPQDITVVECTGSVISPGFINTHEHIEYSTVTPLEDIGERVDHRHDWRRGLRGNTMRPAPVNGSAVEATAWGELRHIFSGTTSIVGGAMVPGLTRNLDFVAGLEAGILSPVATWDIFPLNDARGILRNGDCDYGPNMTNTEAAAKLYRYMAHIGEGVDAEAANEFRCLSDKTYDTTPQQGGGGLSTDIIRPNLALIHALGLSEADFDLVAEREASVVWSPRSNVFLYGKTLNVTYLLDAGITVALGTDWLPSGSATMTREAVCGFSATQTSYGTTLDTKTIWEMMTINAAKVAGFEQHVGSLGVGKVADMAIFGGRGQDDPFAQAVFSDPVDIELVLRGGKVLLADERLDGLAKGLCEPAAFGNVTKTVCVEEELGRSLAAFEASLGGVYPAILPGVPEGEPSCEPTR